MTAREELVRRWLCDVLGSAEPPEAAEVSEDASLRRYLRVRAGDEGVHRDGRSRSPGPVSSPGWI